MAAADSDTRSWQGLPLVDRDGHEVGTIRAVHADSATGTPAWAEVGGRFRRHLVPLGDAVAEGGQVRVGYTRAVIRRAPGLDDGALDEPRLRRHYGGGAVARPLARDDDVGPGERIAQRERIQHELYGGLAPGSVFFGWVVAIGIAALLTAIVSAAGAATGLTEVDEGDAESVGLGGAIALIAALAIAYYAGGYVAGRLARFDGARQGLGVWVLGLAVTLLLAAAAAILDSEINILERLELPRIPIDEGKLTGGAAITLAAIVVGTLIAAVTGGKVGERFHRRVDRVGRGL